LGTAAIREGAGRGPERLRDSTLGRRPVRAPARGAHGGGAPARRGSVSVRPFPLGATAEEWWEAGRLILRLGDARSWGTAKRRDFQNDALIALTARRHGATVVTANRGDFDLLSREIGVQVLPV